MWVYFFTTMYSITGIKILQLFIFYDLMLPFVHFLYQSHNFQPMITVPA